MANWDVYRKVRGSKGDETYGEYVAKNENGEELTDMDLQALYKKIRAVEIPKERLKLIARGAWIEGSYQFYL